VPFRDDDDAPWWSHLEVPEEVLDGPVEEASPELLADWADQRAAEEGDPAAWAGGLGLPCGCAHCVPPEPGVTGALTHAPESLAVRCEAEWKRAQHHLARFWRAVAEMHQHVASQRGAQVAEHVGSDLALITGLHPRTGMNLMATALRAVLDVPELADLVERGELTDRHVGAMLDEAGRWTETAEQAAAVIGLTLDRARDRAAVYGWPSPGELKKRLATAAVLLDLSAMEKRKKSVADRRTVSLSPMGAGAGCLTIEGPDLLMIQAYDAIRARAEAMGQLEGDTRNDEQRMCDAACELLIIDADGGESARPTTGLHGEPLRLVVRGVEIAVITPYSVAQGGELELAEVPGYGPLLPSTARELIENADSFRRVAVDADTGRIINVDDKVPGPARKRRNAQRPQTTVDPHDLDDPENDGDAGGPGGGGGGEPDPIPPDLAPTGHALEPQLNPEPEDDVCDALSPATLALLQRLVRRKVIPFDLGTAHYRVPGRLRRHLEWRDRTCTFPGCHVRATMCDVDHRDTWPRGSTTEANCHCLCRSHHRAKQEYFTVILDTSTGETCWTTPDARTYRRPPPRY
jgi:hypothetical protein